MPIAALPAPFAKSCLRFAEQHH